MSPLKLIQISAKTSLFEVELRRFLGDSIQSTKNLVSQLGSPYMDSCQIRRGFASDICVELQRTRKIFCLFGTH